MTTATFSEFAAQLGCRPSYITSLRKAGRLVLTADEKRVEVEASLQRIEDTRDPSKAGVVARHADARGQALAPSAVEPVPVVTQPTVPDDGSEEADDEALAAQSPDYQLWRARKERAAALREELKLGEEAKLYVKIEDAKAIVADSFVAARSHLEGLSDRLAPALAAEDDEQRVRAILAEEMEVGLSNLSQALGRLGRKES